VDLDVLLLSEPGGSACTTMTTPPPHLTACLNLVCVSACMRARDCTDCGTPYVACDVMSASLPSTWAFFAALYPFLLAPIPFLLLIYSIIERALTTAATAWLAHIDG